MRTLPIIVTLALGVALAAPAAAGIRTYVKTGSGGYFTSMPRSGGVHRRKHHTRLPRHHGVVLFGRHSHHHHRHRERESAPVAAPVVAQPVVATPVEPPPPPDPRGPLRRTYARGIVPAEAPYRLGEALPPGLPHVTLAWRQYDLPEPPPGRLYARVGRDVLLITAAGRVVDRVLPPD